MEHLSPDIAIQRLLGRAPEDRTLFCSWGMSWWKIRDMIKEKMAIENRYQGRKFNYLNDDREKGQLTIIGIIMHMVYNGTNGVSNILIRRYRLCHEQPE